jgi:hypothetical protein
VPNTLAAPPSYFISSMPARLEADAAGVEGDAFTDQGEGFSDFLPPLYCMTIRRGGWSLPWPTA